MEKIFNYTKTLYGKIFSITAALVVFMTFGDFLFKWNIYSFLYSYTDFLWNKMTPYIFEIFIISLIFLILYYLKKLNNRINSSKPNELSNKVDDLKIEFEQQVKKVLEANVAQTKGLEKKMSDKIFDIEYSLVEFEIERYRSNNQVGEVSQMIKKLNMDLQRGWGADETLLEIKAYIERSGMPSYFLDDLHKSIEKLPASIKGVGDTVFNLAQSKVYNPK